MKGIADTGFLVAFGNRGDQYHDWAVQIARRLTEPLLTCEAVLAEACFHLSDPQLALDLVRTRLVTPAFSLIENLPRLMELAERYRDRSPDLADLCVIRMSELNPNHVVITTDVKDFGVYRRNRREVIPQLTPHNAPFGRNQ